MNEQKNDKEQVLVTWYGTTDFCASIGFAESGPIIGALRSGAYKRAVVLGFTNEDKSRGVANATREELLRDAGKAGTPAEKIAVVDRYQNTAVAHGRFKNWLEETLRKAGIRIGCRDPDSDCPIRFFRILLTRLQLSQSRKALYPLYTERRNFASHQLSSQLRIVFRPQSHKSSYQRLWHRHHESRLKTCIFRSQGYARSAPQ